MPMPLSALVLPLLLSNASQAGETCTIQATQWLQDGPLRAAAEGPVLAQAQASPELLAVQVELGADPLSARVRIEDSVARVEAFMAPEDLRLRAVRPLSFADDTIFTGKADLRVREVSATGVKVAPMALPPWIEVASAMGATVACGDLDMVESWPGDLRPLAVGSSERGERMYLKPGLHVELSRIPGSSAPVTLHPQDWMPVEAVSKDASAVRIIARFDGGIVVGWVETDAVADSREPEEVAEPSEEPPAVTAPSHTGEVKVCKKEAPLWVTAEGQDYILGTLSAGTGVILGEKLDDRVQVQGVPSATAWHRIEDVQWWLDAGVARACK
mgnify:CR=1 FL=1